MGINRLFAFIGICLSSLYICHGQSVYDGSWNNPTIDHNRINHYFGIIGTHERNTASDKIEMPAVPGLKYRSCMVVCPIDSCYGQRVLIALRCPDNTVLLDAISGRFCDYSNKITHSTAIRKCEDPESSAAIRSFYIDAIRSYISKHAEHTAGQNLPNEQHGILISDCWQSGGYYTFYEATWFDMDSNSNQTTESYFTVDSKTGKQLQLEDIVPKDNWNHLEQLLPNYLISETGKHYEATDLEPWNFTSHELLENRTGCAVIREGLVIYYHPMVIDGALAGGYKAVIPYDKLTSSLFINK